MLPSSRVNLIPEVPFRQINRTASKIIVLSCEGTVTEESYFNLIGKLFPDVQSKIKFISVVGDILKKREQDRTDEEKKRLTKSQPLQLIEKMDTFKKEKKNEFDFEHHPDDEFWIVADVDHHTDTNNITNWSKALKQCKEKQYECAISNPFFEVWLLLHHTDVTEQDYKYAVTEQHAYEKNDHFKNRLRENKAPLKKKKEVQSKHYNQSKVIQAIERAEELHNKEMESCVDKTQRREYESWPHSLGTTVYKLLKKIVELNEQMKGTNEI